MTQTKKAKAHVRRAFDHKSNSKPKFNGIKVPKVGDDLIIDIKPVMDQFGPTGAYEKCTGKGVGDEILTRKIVSVVQIGTKRFAVRDSAREFWIVYPKGGAWYPDKNQRVHYEN